MNACWAARFSLSAPPLPPKIRTTGGFRFNIASASCREVVKSSVRVGIPTQSASLRYGPAAGKVTKLSVVKREARRLTRPGTEFCSCRKVGTRRVPAATTAGALA